LSPKGHSKWTASKRLSAEGHLLEGSPQPIDPTGKDVGNCKAVNGITKAAAEVFRADDDWQASAFGRRKSDAIGEKGLAAARWPAKQYTCTCRRVMGDKIG
jgi:hypothetical protein